MSQETEVEWVIIFLYRASSKVRGQDRRGYPRSWSRGGGGGEEGRDS
jgi:hypothetical protein